MADDYMVNQQIRDFLLCETSLLDARALKDWLDLVTEDFTYKVPVTSTRDGLNTAAWSEDYLIVDETRDSIEKLWIVRHTDESWDFAWGENPAQRVRRFLANMRVAQSGQPDTYQVHSNELVSFVRESESAVLVPAERIDLVRISDGTPRLAKRLVKIDTSVIRTNHLRMIF